jgi:hypothetical protein
MINYFQAAHLELGDQVYSLYESDLFAKPLIYRVVAFQSTGNAVSGIRYPVIQNGLGERVLLDQDTRDNFTLDYKQATVTLATQAKRLTNYFGGKPMLYNVTIFSVNPNKTYQISSVTEAQAQAAFQTALKNDPDARMLLTPIIDPKNGVTNGN